MRYIIFLLFPLLAFGQEFQIAYGMGFSVDPFTKLIYYVDSFDYKIKSINVDGTGDTETRFPTIPSFAHLEHKAAYPVTNIGGNDSLFLYDFNKDTSHYLLNLFNIDDGTISFSPYDTKLLFSEGMFFSRYYSFQDSLIHDLGIRVNSSTGITKWMDDSTLIYLSSDDFGYSKIIKFSIYNGITDTLISAPDTVAFTGLAYNSKLGYIVYAWEYQMTHNVGINLYKISTTSDSTIFNSQEDDPIGTYIYLSYLSWSPDNDKLGFLGIDDPINPLTQVYVYDTITEKVIRYTEPFETDEGVKYDLTWFNQDTLLYFAYKYEQPPQIFGFDILTPLFLEKTELIKPDHLSIFNFPNPFNSRTTIRFNIVSPGHTEIQIFNSTGQLIRTLNPGKLIPGSHQVDWDGKNNNQEEISSGVYFGIIKVNSYTKMESKVFKMIYLK